MKHTNENDERLGPAQLVAENRAFWDRYRGTWTGPRLTEAEIEDLISEVNPRDTSGWPLVRLDERGNDEERRP